MQCPPPIAEIVLGILRIGLLRIRSKGWEGNAEACAWEADHLHNLPDLLSDFSVERLDYYWTVERLCFIEHVTVEEVSELVPWWDRLSEHVPLDESQKQEMDRRLAAHKTNPAAAIPWEQIEREARDRLGG